jgi:hypothetical protein
MNLINNSEDTQPHPIIEDGTQDQTPRATADNVLGKL